MCIVFSSFLGELNILDFFVQISGGIILFGDDEAKDQAETTINIAKERRELGTLSPLEKAFVNRGNSDLLFAVLHSVKVEGTAEEVLRMLIDAGYDHPQTRWSMIRNVVLSLVIPAR